MKKSIIAFLALFLTFSAFAMPGFTSYIPDSNGEFVYYKDNSFTRESYIGILMYDESKFQVKYYAPKDDTQLLPEKTVAILVSINPESSFWDMTGERIISQITPDSDDLDILNYLHDILYEFSSKRIHIDDFVTEKTLSTEFDLFGGDVSITYSNLVPFFNIKSITNAQGKIAFECAATGVVVDSEDGTFDNFKGINLNTQAAVSKQKSKNNKKAKAAKFTTEDGQSVTLDTDWAQQMENFWTYKDDAILTIGQLPKIFDDSKKNCIFITRKLLQSANDSYTNFAGTEILVNKNGQIKITSDSIQPVENNSIKAIKLVTQNNATGDYFYFSLSAYAKAYAENSAYFDKIVKAYTTK